MYRKNIVGLGAIKPKRTKKNIDLIYKHTLRDYRSFKPNGQKSILYYDEKFGTVLGPIVNLPEKVFEDRLLYALKKEKNLKNKK